jgi:hypothetical protein
MTSRGRRERVTADTLHVDIEGRHDKHRTAQALHVAEHEVAGVTALATEQRAVGMCAGCDVDVI